MKVTIWNENVHERTEDHVRAIYPDGIPIGRGTYVQNDDLGQQSKQIQVTPFVNFDNLSGVVVLELQ